jgi:hypothetical protein
VILTLKTLIWWNLLEKREPFREAFLNEKALKTDICAVRFALITVFSFLQKRSYFYYGTARANALFRGLPLLFKINFWGIAPY